jgi:hypothetical protein
MRLVGFAVATLLLGAVPAWAQYFPRPPMPVGSASARDAAEIVEAMGLNPLGPAMQSGPFFVQRARDDLGRVLRVTVDARRSQVIAVEPVGPRGYAAYRRPYAGYPAMPGYDEGLAPPGSVMAPRPPGVPQHQAAVSPHLPPLVPPNAVPVKPKVKSATVTPQQPAAAPTPRKRPAAAPQEAVGSVEPVAPQAAAAVVPPASTPAAPAQKPATSPAQTLE